jgi:hypothetical protein
MSGLERELAALLKDAPGEPPFVLDPDALQATSQPRRRYLAPLVAAAAVLAAAVPTAVLLNRDSSGQPPSSSRPTKPLQNPADPHQAAIRTAKAIIATAPVPPGATPVERPPLAALDEPASTQGAQYVQRTRFWTAPGAVDNAISYLTSHPPRDMHSPPGTGSRRGPNIPTTQTLDFQADEFRTLQYSVVAYHNGVAVRADAQVLWAPRRSPADTVPTSVTSVDVVVVRQNPQRRQGAPTVSRTLTGADARALAHFVNRLPRAVPTGYVSCPDMLGGEHRLDRLTFHSAGANAHLLVNLTGCATTTLTVGHRKPIQLSFTFPGAVATIDHQILSAVGLPPNYGR